MSAGATQWAWANSRASNGSLIVLLAIADECDESGEVEMSMTALAAKSRLSDKAARNAVKDLAALGELSVTRCAGGISRYALPLATVVDSPADITGPPRQNLPDQWSTSPAHITGPVDSATTEPQVSGGPVKTTGPEIRDDLDLGSVVSGEKSKSRSSRRKPQPDRPDVERVCQHLADRLVANGCRKPAIGKEWRDAARLLIDKDGISEERIHLAIDWSQQDHFWHRNIHSMPTLRKQFDKLRLAALAEQREKSRPRNGHQPSQDEFAALRDNWARPLDEMEARNDPRGNDGPHAVHRRDLPPAAD